MHGFGIVHIGMIPNIQTNDDLMHELLQPCKINYEMGNVHKTRGLPGVKFNSDSLTLVDLHGGST